MPIKLADLVWNPICPWLKGKVVTSGFLIYCSMRPFLGWYTLFFSWKTVNLEPTNCWRGGVCPKIREKQLILMMSPTNCVPPPSLRILRIYSSHFQDNRGVFDVLAEDGEMSVYRTLKCVISLLERKINKNLLPTVIQGNTGWSKTCAPHSGRRSGMTWCSSDKTGLKYS